MPWESSIPIFWIPRFSFVYVSEFCCVTCAVTVWVVLYIQLYLSNIYIIIIITVIITKAGFHSMFLDFRKALLFERFPGFHRLTSSNRGVPSSITGQSMCWFFKDKVTLWRACLPAFQFLLSVSSHQRSTLLFIYTMLLPGRTPKVWGRSKKQCSFGNRRVLIVTLIIIMPS